jgi:PAS domain S-box-containing protein
MRHKLWGFRKPLIAVAASSAGAAALSHLVGPAIGSRAPFLFHVLAVAIASQIAGTAAGIVTTALGILLVAWPAPSSDTHMPVVLAIFGAVGTCVSISSGWRRRAEDEIRGVRYNLETAQRIASLGSWQSDLAGDLWWSEETYRIFGVARGTPLRTSIFYELVHPEDRAMVREAVQRTVETGADYDIEHRIVRRSDGEVRSVRQRAKVAANGAVHLIGSVQDVTGARKTLDDLERVGRTMSLALEATHSGAWLWNLDTGELTWSETYFQLLGVDPGVSPSLELLSSLVHPDDLGHFQASLREVRDGRSPEFHEEFRIRRGGGIRWLEKRGRVFPGADGRSPQLVGITTDITERKILRGLLPTCAYCKRIRDEEGRWHLLETYLSAHSRARFSHGMCPDCYHKAMAEEAGAPPSCKP